MSSSVFEYSSDISFDHYKSDNDDESFTDDLGNRPVSPPVSVERVRTPPPAGYVVHPYVCAWTVILSLLAHSRVILRYKGYLNFVHEVCQTDLESLQHGEELNDRVIDVLMAYVHRAIKVEMHLK